MNKISFCITIILGLTLIAMFLNNVEAVPETDKHAFVESNVLRRLKRSLIVVGICPEGQVYKGFPFGCITCADYEEITEEKC